jgi:hypothetical protein
MDREQLDSMKASIIADYTAKIDKLKEEMKMELSLLSRFVARFEDTSSISESPVRRIRIHARSESGEKLPVARDRILATKKVLRGRFSREELHDAVNKDGFGEMKKGTFSPYTSRMIADGEIVEVEKASGTRPSTYMWPEEYQEYKEKHIDPLTNQQEIF